MKKTKLFSQYALAEQEDFTRDLAKFVDLRPEQAAAFAHLIPKLAGQTTEAAATELFNREASEIGIDVAHLRQNISIANFFIGELRPGGTAEGDDVDDLVKDALGEAPANPAAPATLKAFLIEARSVAAGDYSLERQRRKHQEMALPTLQGLAATINMRAVFEESPLGSDHEDFDPACLELTPVAVIQLGFDSDASPRRVSFQASPAELRYLIRRLEAVERQIDRAGAGERPGQIR